MRNTIGSGLLLAIVLGGCPPPKDDTKRLTWAEAQEAVKEAALASQAENLTSVTVEISTSFTIGQAVENAAAEVRAFIESQLPCAEVGLDGATLTVQYGAKAGSCTYRGHTFSGTHSITIASAGGGQLEVQHTWTGLSNGRVTLDGTAAVTWDLQAKTRRVVHTADWKRVADGYAVTGSGDRTQSLLEGGLAEGIQVDGARSWETPKGNWDLAIDGVQMRWVDPVPQAGSYTLATPRGRNLSMSFERLDEDTITVTVSGGSNSFDFNVTKIGAVSSGG
ncbi:MAG: hypothetical protein KF718_19395 [Polyangiaceae bacterium]|nr:hypothetical protein [Polyangiaceae bacterium]